MSTNDYQPELVGCRLAYVTNRARSAKWASVTAYGPALADELEHWQRELCGNGMPEDTTVVVVDKAGRLVSYAGPMYYSRSAQLARLGVSNLPTYGPNRH